MTNNHVEAYALFQRIQLAKENQVASINVLEDSLLIQHLVKGSSLRDRDIRKSYEKN